MHTHTNTTHTTHSSLHTHTHTHTKKKTGAPRARRPAARAARVLWPPGPQGLQGREAAGVGGSWRRRRRRRRRVERAPPPAARPPPGASSCPLRPPTRSPIFLFLAHALYSGSTPDCAKGGSYDGPFEGGTPLAGCGVCVLRTRPRLSTPAAPISKQRQRFHSPCAPCRSLQRPRGAAHGGGSAVAPSPFGAARRASTLHRAAAATCVCASARAHTHSIAPQTCLSVKHVTSTSDKLIPCKGESWLLRRARHHCLQRDPTNARTRPTFARPAAIERPTATPSSAFRV